MTVSASPSIDRLRNACSSRISPTSPPPSPSSHHPLINTDGTNDSGEVSTASGNAPPGTHSMRNVLTLQAKVGIPRWIVLEAETSWTDKHLQTKTVRNFPQYFRSYHSANYMRTKHIWDDHQKKLFGCLTNFGPTEHPNDYFRFICAEAW